MRLRSSHLFAPQYVLDAADSVLDFALGLIGFAVRFQLGVANKFARNFFNRALSLLCRSLNSVLVQGYFLSCQVFLKIQRAK